MVTPRFSLQRRSKTVNSKGPLKIIARRDAPLSLEPAPQIRSIRRHGRGDDRAQPRVFELELRRWKIG